MKKIIISVLTIVIIAVLFIVISLFTSDENYKPNGEITDSMVKSATAMLNESLTTPKYTYIDFLNEARQEINYDLEDVAGTLTSENKYQNSDYTGEIVDLERNDTVEYHVNAPSAGYYFINLDYNFLSYTLNNIALSVKVNDEFQYDDAKTIEIQLRWEDETKNFSLDSYGDETLPAQKYIDGWQTVTLYNNTYTTVEPLLFYLNEGDNKIEIQNISSVDINVGNLSAIAPNETPTYSEYIANKPNRTTDYIQFVNSTEYVEKNSSYIRLSSYKNPAITPFHPIDKKLNIIDGYSWRTAGQEAIYKISVPEDGRYKIAFHYMNSKNDFSVFRTIKIDGVVPFEEMKAYEFDPTDSEWANKTLADESGKAYEFYLTKGEHTLSVRADIEPVSDELRNIQLLIDHINKFSLDIRKITGKEVDQNRLWKLTKYIPETDLYLEAYETIIKDMIENLSEYAPNAENSSTLSYLQKSLYKLEMMREKPDELPLYLEDLSGGTGSVAQMLGDSMTTIKEQPLYLDGFYVYHNEKLESANAGFFKKISTSFQSFFASFTTKKYVIKNDPDAINIWVNRPVTYVDTMQKMVDSQFTKDTGIKVKISIMPDVQKLILASAADQQPDVALGLPSYMPYDLAIRNAAYDLTSFDDFWTYANNFAPGQFVPYILNDKAYAIPETLDFNALMYRTDTFEALNLDVPNTWDEVIEILPELQRYGMNFYHPIAGGNSLKWFYQTTPFILQNGGALYTEDGMKTAINSPEAVKGLTFLNKLFTNYSLPEQVPSFYNSFRYGTYPVGIADFGTYLQMKNAAPELVGQWELADNPGTVQADGSVSRWYIANGTSGVILNSTKHAEDSWAFMKWWMDAKTQSEFAFTLQSTFGPEYVWLSANLTAVENTPIDKKDRDIILDQIDWLRDVPRTPGQYMLERGISDIWNTAVFEGTPTQIAVDKQTIAINREITKKMIEFGFIDEQGNTIKPYVIRDVDWIRQKMNEAKE